MTKSRRLRELFNRPGLIRVVGAHDGLTARLVEDASFEAVWASSLEVSASHLVPDANILTMEDHLSAAVEMNDAVSIPVVVDADQGYGNCSNVVRMVEKFEAAGIAGVVIEDNPFPKQNSLLETRRELVSIEEFVGKIIAGKHAQRTRDFMLIARVEALIAGYGLGEALRRARAYARAGADAIFIHSRRTDPSEIVEFADRWDGVVPLVIVPTKYPSFTEQRVRSHPKIKMVIYANHVIRTVVAAVRQTLAEISQTGGIETISPRLVPVNELFELQGTFKMKSDERMFRDKAEIVVQSTDREGREVTPLLSLAAEMRLSVGGRVPPPHLLVDDLVHPYRYENPNDCRGGKT